MADAFHLQPEADPLDYRFSAPHMMLLDGLPRYFPNPFQAVDYPTTTGYSPENPIYGNEVQQSIPLGLSSGVCLWPTFPPSEHGCCHTSCSPPSDVESLSRRFTENEKWIQVRASAVASLAFRRGGCKSPYSAVRSTTELTDLSCYSLLRTDRNHGDDSRTFSYPQSTG